MILIVQDTHFSRIQNVRYGTQWWTTVQRWSVGFRADTHARWCGWRVKKEIQFFGLIDPSSTSNNSSYTERRPKEARKTEFIYEWQVWNEPSYSQDTQRGHLRIYINVNTEWFLKHARPVSTKYKVYLSNIFTYNIQNYDFIKMYSFDYYLPSKCFQFFHFLKCQLSYLLLNLCKRECLFLTICYFNFYNIRPIVISVLNLE